MTIYLDFEQILWWIGLSSVIGYFSALITCVSRFIIKKSETIYRNDDDEFFTNISIIFWPVAILIACIGLTALFFLMIDDKFFSKNRFLNILITKPALLIYRKSKKIKKWIKDAFASRKIKKIKRDLTKAIKEQNNLNQTPVFNSDLSPEEKIEKLQQIKQLL